MSNGTKSARRTTRKKLRSAVLSVPITLSPKPNFLRHTALLVPIANRSR